MGVTPPLPDGAWSLSRFTPLYGSSGLHPFQPAAEPALDMRGRVGRGSVASVCVLLYASPLSPTAKDRLKAMVETTDGFEIARRDLEIRGPGEFMGARQSGAELLRFADLQEDSALLKAARALAPQLLDREPRAAEKHVERWLGSKAEFLKA